jgi:glycerol-3-phosphate acyltransferase PlsY
MTDQPILWFTVFPAAAYLAGSIPFGVLIAALHGVDLRKSGSGNVGATNVGRTLGRGWGILCFALDVAQGLGPTLLTGWLLGAIGSSRTPSPVQQGAWLATGAASVFGHVFSLFLRFRGGKGVATSLGVVLGIFPYFTWPGLVVFGAWILVTFVSRYVSAGSIAAAALFAPVFALFHLGEIRALWPLAVFAAIIAALILVRHASNIRRLLAGTENKIGKGKSKPRP